MLLSMNFSRAACDADAI